MKKNTGILLLVVLALLLGLYAPACAQPCTTDVMVASVPSPDDVVDGDTFWARVQLPDLDPSNTLRSHREEWMRCRLYRCDAPDEDTHGRARTEAATNYTRNLIAEGLVILQYRGKDKFGRAVVTLHFEDGETLCEKLEKNGHTTGRYTRARHPRRRTY